MVLAHPGFVRTAPTRPRRLLGRAVLSSYRTAATARRQWSFTPARINSASRRTKGTMNAFDLAFDGRLTAGQL
ncbi:hypothetical protein GCM10010278_81130 [Streptomyces melanogenes]|nr:hypothetical protein GCM10010278_81130 [Streptomyces melanogenes]